MLNGELTNVIRAEAPRTAAARRNLAAYTTFRSLAFPQIRLSRIGSNSIRIIGTTREGVRMASYTVDILYDNPRSAIFSYRPEGCATSVTYQ